MPHYDEARLVITFRPSERKFRDKLMPD